jgi:hypothetical protein
MYSVTSSKIAGGVEVGYDEDFFQVFLFEPDYRLL